MVSRSLRRRSARQSARDESLSIARRELRTHTLRDAESRAFEFRRRGGNWDWGFTLTWTPGHLTLAGDLGELTLVHYSALREFEAGIEWAERGSYDYLMEKTGLHPTELSREDTANQIISMASDNAAYYRLWERRSDQGERKRARAYHRDWEEALEEWNYSRDGDAPKARDYLPWLELEDEYRAAVSRAHQCWAEMMSEWNYSRQGPAPKLVPLLPDPSEFRYWERERARFVIGPNPDWHRTMVVKDVWDVPDGWDAWFQLFDKVYCIHGDGWIDSDPNMLLTPAGRRKVADSLRYYLSDASGEKAAELCAELGLDDYYGSYDYPLRSVAQIEAIKTGCVLILDMLHPRRAWGKSWSDPVV